MNFFLKVAFSKPRFVWQKLFLYTTRRSQNLLEKSYRRIECRIECDKMTLPSLCQFSAFFVRNKFFQARSVKVFDESRMKPFVELVGDFGIFSSQDYPSSYPPNWKQTFRITSKPQTILVIKFQVIRGWSHFTSKVVWFNLFWLKGYSISDSAFAGRLELTKKIFPVLKFV